MYKLLFSKFFMFPHKRRPAPEPITTLVKMGKGRPPRVPWKQNGVFRARPTSPGLTTTSEKVSPVGRNLPFPNLMLIDSVYYSLQYEYFSQTPLLSVHYCMY